MTNEEALEYLKNSYCTESDLEINPQAYQHNAVIDLAISALEKQIPKKPIIKTNAYNRKFYECPNCGIDMEHVIFSPYMYCHKCGQKIDKEVSE